MEKRLDTMDNLESKNKILIADDSEEIREILSILLIGAGYQVITALDGKEAIEKVDDSVTLIILDVNMPEKSGFLACSEIRKKSFVPILFLTARTHESDKTMGFLAGGDDYISKPFSNSELLLRVKALIRRYSHYGSCTIEEPKTLLCIFDLELNTDTKQVTKNGKQILLTSTEYNILFLLASNRKKVFSMENLYNSIWQDVPMSTSDNAIMVHIKNLRKKIEDNPRNPKYIKTAWGKGYYVD